jgi:hypothetical protein
MTEEPGLTAGADAPDEGGGGPPSQADPPGRPDSAGQPSLPGSLGSLPGAPEPGPEPGPGTAEPRKSWRESILVAAIIGAVATILAAVLAIVFAPSGSNSVTAKPVETLLPHRVTPSLRVTFSSRVRWAFRTYGAVNSSPVISDGTVYVSSGDCSVYALNTAL